MNSCTSRNLASCSKLLADLASSYSNKLESGKLSLPSGLGKTPATEKKHNKKDKQASKQTQEKNFFGGWGPISIFWIMGNQCERCIYQLHPSTTN